MIMQKLSSVPNEAIEPDLVNKKIEHNFFTLPGWFPRRSLALSHRSYRCTSLLHTLLLHDWSDATAKSIPESLKAVMINVYGKLLSKEIVLSDKKPR